MDDHTAQESEPFYPQTIAQMAILVATYLKTNHQPRGSRPLPGRRAPDRPGHRHLPPERPDKHLQRREKDTRLQHPPQRQTHTRPVQPRRVDKVPGPAGRTGRESPAGRRAVAEKKGKKQITGRSSTPSTTGRYSPDESSGPAEGEPNETGGNPTTGRARRQHGLREPQHNENLGPDNQRSQAGAGPVGDHGLPAPLQGRLGPARLGDPPGQSPGERRRRSPATGSKPAIGPNGTTPPSPWP